MEVEWDNQLAWGMAILITLIMIVVIVKVPNWDNVALWQRILIILFAGPITFAIIQRAS